MQPFKVEFVNTVGNPKETAGGGGEIGWAKVATGTILAYPSTTRANKPKTEINLCLTFSV